MKATLAIQLHDIVDFTYTGIYTLQPCAMLAVTQPLSGHLNTKLYNKSRGQVFNDLKYNYKKELLVIS